MSVYFPPRTSSSPAPSAQGGALHQIAARSYNGLKAAAITGGGALCMEFGVKAAAPLFHITTAAANLDPVIAVTMLVTVPAALLWAGARLCIR